ncbi:UDP-N-acetylglucosamine--N-acetylmuramyl-(pentapeptide) pyrophosphoryl-undecaprenol N-acetylglucosamine transferase [Methanobacterium paludis]|uniref:Glycosyltransferase 28 domain protein n=1 Tax=Methanobacterium paludis (strain DSM 25820 / JCM 18151 / SWAN1) TaxID=868131 RepID=F6D800_METPW|nr:UDP-N-acetylglucosamine--N-acetylmuramyl-(pentapeptide) pyrophosphoryl-undecaprenol N-acetylglucosamine transferase [Methanobacterium paludis]AEG18523.1 Glycosyltransferase 28 domain protein [Methanobacterium paludis]
MKVLIIPCGIGMGHVSRCIALAGKLQEEGADVLFASYGSGYEMLKEYNDYKAVKLPELKFYGPVGELDIKYTVKKSIDTPFVFLRSIYQESKVIKKFKPDIIVADSHFSVPITAKVLGIPCVLVTNELTFNFSDINPNDRTVEYLENGLERFVKDVSNLCKTIIVPDVEDSIKIPPRLSEITTHVGPFLKKRPENMPDKDELRRKLGFGSGDKLVFVTVGGSDFGIGLLKLICHASSMIDCDKLIMVTGPQIDTDFIPDCEKIIKKKFLWDMMEWMAIADVVVTLAGHTTVMEVTSLGIPNIVVPINNHPEQLKNAVHVEKYGISLVEDIKKLTAEGIAEDINNTLNNVDMKRNAEIVREQFSKYSGTEDAVRIILKYAEDWEQPL